MADLLTDLWIKSVYFADSVHFLNLFPSLVLTCWVCRGVSTAYKEGSTATRRSGRETAEAVLNEARVSKVKIEAVEAEPTEHFDPLAKTLRLSPEVDEGRTLTSVGIAVHETGHAIQSSLAFPLAVAQSVVVLASRLASTVSWLLVVSGLLAGVFPLVGYGIRLFAFNVVVRLVDLPVEIDASRRALKVLQVSGVLEPGEERVVGRIIEAAGWSGVAEPLTAGWKPLARFIRNWSLRRRSSLRNSRGRDRPECAG